MILADTSGLFSAIDRSQTHHEVVRSFVEASDDVLVISPFVLAELDYLVSTRLGAEAELTVLEDVAAGAYDLAPFSVDDVAAAVSVVCRFGSSGIGLTDASIVVLAERYATDRVLTLDERRFRALRTSEGKAFTVLPADR